MKPDDPPLDAVAAAILDGGTVDWAAVLSHADPERRGLLDQLRMLACVADLHRGSTIAAGTATDLEAPCEWGHLRVLERIGCGAFGDVYRAWDTRLDREVALKLLPPSSTDGDPRTTSVIEEGRMLARVRHPNVVTIYGADRIDDRAGLWMERVSGRTLQEMVDDGRSFTADEVVRIGIDLCQAIEAVHAAGLLHRDIKPHNVMIAENSRVVLMDLGAGHERNDAVAAGLAGTPLYMAPEVLSGGAPTITSDIYSVGVLLYYLVSRSYPVQAKSLRRLRLAHDRCHRIEIGARRRDLPSTLRRVIECATDPQPEKRYASAQDLGAALTRVGVRRRWARWTYAMAGIALLTVMAGWGVVRGGRGQHFGPSRSLDVRETPLRSVAVLPFTSHADGENDDRLAIGLTEALIVQLGRLETVRVEPIATVNRYRSSPPRDPVDAARELGVDAVIAGSLQETDRGVVVRVQMRRTVDGALLLSQDSGDTPLADLVEAATRLGASLTAILQPAMTSAERARVARPDTKSSEAFRHYLFGRYHMEVRSLERMLEAEREFRAAITLDPSYARAHAALSVALTHSAFLGGRRGIDVMEAAKDAAMTALALDDSVALAHTALAYVLECFEYDQLHSQAEHLRAMALDNADLWVLRAYASFLMRRGASDESLVVIRRAVELDPASPLSNRHYAMLLYAARRYDECTSVSRTTLPLDPHDSSLSYKWLAKCLEAQGRPAEAVEAYENGRSAHGDPETAERMKALYRAKGWRAYWRERLHVENDGTGASAAQALVRLGRKQEAIDLYEKGFESRAPWVGYINHPEWDPLLGDPRFEAMRDRLGLSEGVSAQLSAARAMRR